MTLTFGSVCSGIEAASVAWGPLGWRAAWLAEIESFPNALLTHHYPETPNLGDMTTIARRILAGEIVAPPLLCGGTPCQAFSIAGLRASLDDARGNLTLKFVELADAIDFVRARSGDPESIITWENVPGVLSTKDNAFGCFLAGLAGEDEPLQPAGKRWSNSGCVYGPKRAIAWRTLDAQYFGLAQRRRRVFVVASARNGFDPARVLFEWQGLRRDSAPRRATREEIAASLTASAGHHGYSSPRGDGSDNLIAEVCPTLRAGGNSTGGDRPPGTDVNTCESLIVESHLVPELLCVAHGQAGAEIAAEMSPTLSCNHEAPYIAGAVSVALRGREGGATAELGDDAAFTLRASTGGGDKPHVMAPVAFAENSHAELRLEGGDGQRTGALSTGGGKPGQGVPMIAFSAKDYGADANSEISPTMRAGGHANSHANAGVMPAVQQGMSVRRLTPRECERLQGFPDDYTMIPTKRVPAKGQEKARERAAAGDERFAEIDGVMWVVSADGPRYKALGNSMAVNVMRWIGWRIEAELEATA